jgi:hypothetical protein
MAGISLDTLVALGTLIRRFMLSPLKLSLGGRSLSSFMWKPSLGLMKLKKWLI